MSVRVPHVTGVATDTALRLARHFGTTDRFWHNLQTRFDLEVEEDQPGPSLEEIRPFTNTYAGPPAV
jgi:plasmid maintenance system antidote protein VapI